LLAKGEESLQLPSNEYKRAIVCWARVMVRRQRTKKRTIGTIMKKHRLEEEGTKKHEAARHVAKDHNWGKCMRSTTVRTENTKRLNR
jgi:hypothetical protein